MPEEKKNKHLWQVTGKNRKIKSQWTTSSMERNPSPSYQELTLVRLYTLMRWKLWIYIFKQLYFSRLPQFVIKRLNINMYIWVISPIKPNPKPSHALWPNRARWTECQMPFRTELQAALLILILHEGSMQCIICNSEHRMYKIRKFSPLSLQ